MKEFMALIRKQGTTWSDLIAGRVAIPEQADGLYRKTGKKMVT